MNHILEQLALSDIKPYSNNPRLHNKTHIKEIVESIQAFSFTNPILVDEERIILAGHGRYLAAQKLGLEKVPVIILQHLNADQKRAYRIADNKLTENGQWDTNLLQFEFQALDTPDLNFDLEVTGFSTTAIDLLLISEGNAKPEAPLPPLITSPVSKRGELWLLGKNRLYCGDSLIKESYEVLMEDKKARMIFTDPPYNVKIQGHVSTTAKHAEFAYASGEMSDVEFVSFLSKTINHLIDYSMNGSLHYICMDWRHVYPLMQAAAGYSELKNICVWNKDNGGMGSLYRSKHEFVFVFKQGDASHINNIELGKNGRYRTNVWDYPGVNHPGNEAIAHPTVKPIALVKDAILDVTRRGEIVLDAFTGSGTTILAAEESNRIAYGIEYEPRYVDLTIKRWQQMTGKEACRVDGVKFNELESMHE